MASLHLQLRHKPFNQLRANSQLNKQPLQLTLPDKRLKHRPQALTAPWYQKPDLRHPLPYLSTGATV